MDNIINEEVIANNPEASIVRARSLFVYNYIKAKGWDEGSGWDFDLNKLTFSQIQEIRDQEGWKNAGK